MYGWMQAIDEAMVTTHLGTAETSDSYETARRKLGELIDWHIAVAKDPRVNGGFVLTPTEPTNDMVAATWEFHAEDGFLPAALYRAMIQAAPKP